MPEFRTTTCRALGHPEIGIAVDNAPASSAESLLRGFESEVRRGVTYLEGQTIQIGWAVAKFVGRGSGDLELYEPSFDEFPMRWMRGLDSTIRHATLQRAVCEALACEPVFPSLLDIGVVSLGFVAGLTEFILSRDQPSGSDSGWGFREWSKQDEAACWQSLFEVGVTQPRVISFLALPVGAEVRCTSDSVEIEFDGRSVSSSANGFLRQLVDSPAWKT